MADELPNPIRRDDVRKAPPAEEPIPKGGKLIPVITTIDFLALEAHPEADKKLWADIGQQAGLRDSIRKNGIRTGDQIVLRRHEGKLKIGDGRNRYKCAKDVRHRFTNADFVEFVGTEEEFVEFVRDRNTRRHETAEERADAAKALVKANPGMPLRELAVLARLSHTRIAQLKKEIEEEGKPKAEDTTKYDAIVKAHKALVKAWNGAEEKDRDKFVDFHGIDPEGLALEGL
jgi:hypothetical protein